jgi:hypothetical protein
MIAPLAKLMDWSAVQAVALLTSALMGDHFMIPNPAALARYFAAANDHSA